MKDQDLDRLFKEKLSEAAYPYNPDNWKRMEQLLDGRPTGLAPWYWRFSAAILAVGFVLAGVVLFQPEPAQQSPSATLPAALSPSSRALPYSNSKTLGPSRSETVHESEEQLIVPYTRGTFPTDRATTTPSDGYQGSATVAAQSGAKETPASSAPAPSNKKAGSQASGLHSSVNEDAKAEQSSRTTANVGPLRPSRIALDGLGALPVLTVKEVWLADSVSQARHGSQEADFIPGEPAFAQHRLLLEGGLTLSSSFGNGYATGYVGGIVYQWQPNGNFGISMGFNFRQTGDLSIATREDTTYFTNQGRQDVTTVKRFAYFQTLNFPLQANWHINHKHALSAGMYLSLALRQKAELVTTTQQPKSTTEVARDEVSGQHPEFTGNLMGLSLGYTYQINKKLEAGIQFRYGLSDMTQDRIAPELASFHRLKQTELVLRYRLF